MNIVLIGAGSLGTTIASVLSQQEHNVVLVDKDLYQLNLVGRDLDVATIHGFASNWKLLDNLLENKPQLFLAMTGDDETNLTACAIAKNLGYPKTICRIKDLGYLTRSRIDFNRLFFVDHFIAPEILAAQDILKILISSSEEGVENFAHGAIQMKTIKIPENCDKTNTYIKDLSLPKELIIGAILREEKVLFPHGEDKLFPKDEVTFFGELASMAELCHFFKISKTKIKNVAIVGGSSIALHLCKILENQQTQVKIFEKNPLRCKFLADHLKTSVILHHDAKDFSFLLSEKIKDCDAVIICTRNDEMNIFLSMLAKKAEAKKVITLISDSNIHSSLREIGITPSVSEKVNITNRVLSIVHEDNILSIASLFDNRAKVIELTVSSHSKLVGIPLCDLKALIPKDLLIAVIENKGKVMIGKGGRILSPHDTVILISPPHHIQELQELF